MEDSGPANSGPATAEQIHKSLQRQYVEAYQLREGLVLGDPTQYKLGNELFKLKTEYKRLENKSKLFLKELNNMQQELSNNFPNQHEQLPKNVIEASLENFANAAKVMSDMKEIADQIGHFWHEIGKTRPDVMILNRHIDDMVTRRDEALQVLRGFQIPVEEQVPDEKQVPDNGDVEDLD
jgi:predicted nuclease with TOPRIM domain